MAPYAQAIVMLMYGDVPSFGHAKGITEEEPLVTGLERMLTPGSSSKLADDQIVIGENIAQRLGIQLGDTLTIYSPVSFVGLTHDEIIFSQDLKVAGFFSAESYLARRSRFFPGLHAKTL